MLDRIKKRQIDGFKEFVQNMEITGPEARIPIFTTGILEDPIFMGWVMKNLKTFDDFIALPSDDIEAVLTSQEQVLNIFAKCMFDAPEEKLMALESVIPKHMYKFKDELSYMKDITPAQRESARYFIIKTVRKLQAQELIRGFSWQLPPMDVFYNKVHKDGEGEIIFENGVLAAKGEYLKGKRCGSWKHYYETGKLLAEGDYLDGNKTGKWTFYFGNGERRAEGVYKGDQRSGFWKEWDRSGNMTETEYHEGGKKS